MHLVAPFLFNLDKQFQMATVTQEVFDLVTSARADLLQARRAFANYDFLLRRPLDENGAVDAREPFALLFPFLSNHGRDVRNFFRGHLQNFFAHDLRRKCAQRLISKLVFAK
jgi:hypothetical protein